MIESINRQATVHRILATAVWITCATTTPGTLRPAAANAQPTTEAGASVCPITTGNIQLEAKVDAIIRDARLTGADWGIAVVEARSLEPLLCRNAQRLFVPASNLKLVVAAAALQYLGADYQYNTSLYGTGAIRSGTLTGDLVLFGRGDPTISGRYYDTRTAVWDSLADSLWIKGVRRITGRIVADQSFWDTSYTRPEWSAYDRRWWYAAPVAPLGFNDNAIDFRVAPGNRSGAPARITWLPRSAYVRFANRTRTVPAGQTYTLDFARVPGTDSVIARGDIPLGAGVRIEYFAVYNPGRYAATALGEALVRRGIEVGEEVPVIVSDPHRSPVASAEVLADWKSPPLAQFVQPVLRTSQNWFAEQLVKTIGREVEGEGSWEAGLRLETEFLTDVVGLDGSSFVLRDASGLSRGNRITPAALVQILAYGLTMPDASVVREALPAPGQKGSLRTRLPDLAGRVRAKTGYIRNVDSLSGYLATSDGDELIFSIIVNNPEAPSGRVKGAIDDIVQAIAAYERQE